MSKDGTFRVSVVSVPRQASTFGVALWNGTWTCLNRMVASTVISMSPSLKRRIVALVAIVILEQLGDAQKWITLKTMVGAFKQRHGTKIHQAETRAGMVGAVVCLGAWFT